MFITKKWLTRSSKGDSGKDEIIVGTAVVPDFQLIKSLGDEIDEVHGISSRLHSLHHNLITGNSKIYVGKCKLTAVETNLMSHWGSS